MTTLAITLWFLIPFLYSALGIVHTKLFFMRYPSLYNRKNPAYEDWNQRYPRYLTNKAMVVTVGTLWPFFLVWWALNLTWIIYNALVMIPVGFLYRKTSPALNVTGSMLSSGGAMLGEFVKPKER